LDINLKEIAQRLNLELVGDGSVEISGIANLIDASATELTFLFSVGYKKHLETTSAAAVILRREDADGCAIPAIISPQPRLSWGHVAALFDREPVPDGNIHPSAVIHQAAKLSENVTIGANAVIESGAEIGPDSAIGPGCVVGQQVIVGKNCRINANVTLYHHIQLGDRVIVHAGAVIGADGFGFEFDGATGTLVKISQIYSVIIGNDVEIGAGTTIDRGALNDTLIGDGVKLDNQVQIGHGTQVGANTAISGCTAIAGSTKIGSYCLIGGAVGIIDNIEIADQVEITAKSLVSQSITEKGRYSSGTGLMQSKDWKRNIVVFKKLDKLLRRVRGLEAKIR
jgi:UDP-3-O-[3-hydroxymyristoyl] glucosamine N-acyltransferase